MLFCTQAYLLFFTVIFLTYWAMPWPRVRVWLLLIASFYFYACWNHWLAGLIGLSVFVDYWLARGMDAGFSPRVRKAFLTTSIVANLGLLCYFKYVNFFLGSLESALHAVGASTSMPVLQIILPVGISFYTFEAINYAVDVYTGKVRAERSLADLMLFVTFFPHLVAGPIVRARDFLPQIKRPKRWSWARMNLGVQYFLMGLVKKLVIADRLAYFVDPIFANPEAYSSHHVWIAIFAYSLQIYGDFSGYSDMAIGSAHMLGYKLAINFNMPYLASSISDFWKRWHISLSSWLRDYLFIPLGGTRGASWIVYRNLLVTMLLSGLWHGANWTFVIFGGAHAILLIINHAFRGFYQDRDWLRRILESRLGTCLCVGATFVTLTLAWVLFRAPTLAGAGAIYERLFIPHQGWELSPIHATNLLYSALILAIGHWVALQSWFKRAAIRLPEPALAVSYACILTVVLVLTPGNNNAFIYFQF